MFHFIAQAYRPTTQSKTQKVFDRSFIVPVRRSHSFFSMHGPAYGNMQVLLPDSRLIITNITSCKSDICFGKKRKASVIQQAVADTGGWWDASPLEGTQFFSGLRNTARGLCAYSTANLLFFLQNSLQCCIVVSSLLEILIRPIHIT